MRRLQLPIIWLLFGLAWLLPVHKDGVRFPESVPGWEAFRVAAAPIWPYEGVAYDAWWGALLAVLSAGTNLVMFCTLGIRRRSVSFRRWLAGISAGAFAVNAQWLVWNTELADLRIGYYLWWLSFLALGASLSFSTLTAGPARPLRDAG